MVQPLQCVTLEDLNAVFGSGAIRTCKTRYSLKTLDGLEEFELPVTFIANVTEREIGLETQSSNRGTTLISYIAEEPKKIPCTVRFLRADMIAAFPKTPDELRKYVESFFQFLYKGSILLVDNETNRYITVIADSPDEEIERLPFTNLYELEFDFIAYDPFSYSTGVTYKPLYGDYVEKGNLLNSDGLCLVNSDGSYLAYQGYIASQSPSLFTGSSAITVENRGNYFVYPNIEIKVTSNTSVLRLTNSTNGDKFSVEGGLAAGDTLTIDTLTPLAHINGLPVLQKMSLDFFKHFVLSTGENILELSIDPETTVTIIVSYRERWI